MAQDRPRKHTRGKDLVAPIPPHHDPQGPPATDPPRFRRAEDLPPSRPAPTVRSLTPLGQRAVPDRGGDE